VLATSIAETSLTIEGVRIVVDGGLMRVPRFDPRTGMTRLETIPVSQASSEQRRGRAGRLAPGVCYRLWPEGAQRALAPFTAPEILAADLAPLALELARWGEPDPSRLAWLDAPPDAAFRQARALLQRLGALGADSHITPHGRELARLGVHPRLAHMMLTGRGLGFGDLAADLAALLGERDPLRGVAGGGDADLRSRLALVRREEWAGEAGDQAVLRRIREQAKQYRRQLGIGQQAPSALERTGLALALAYPDRIAQLRPGNSGASERQYLLSGGSGAYFRNAQPLAAEPYLAIADLDGERSNAEIYSAAPLTQAEIESAFADVIATVERVEWVKRDRIVLARRQRSLGALVLKEERLDRPPRERLVAAFLDGLRDLGLDTLAWSKEAQSFRARILFLRRIEGDSWPDYSDAALLATLEEWLAPHLAAMMRFDQLRTLDPLPILQAGLDWPQRRRLDELAPTHCTVPSGSRLPIDYSGEAPVLAVRLQEMFGASETPSIAGGRVKLLLHLLSPAQRPMQVTSDLAGFWRNTYPQVRGELRGQYPKHSWPDDPLTAPPTARAKRRGSA
jgi:ATP-dependent helicase HrpB